VVAFDTASGARLAEIQVDVAPYDIVLDPKATGCLFNWASKSISVVDMNK
jgi:hypothetical protein